MKKAFDVLVVGELNMDIILNKIDGYPEVGKEILADELNITMGSSSAIFASNLSTLETRVAFMGKIGRDDFGQMIQKSLSQRSVATDFIIDTPDYATGTTIVLNYDMDRAMVTNPGAMEHLTLDDISDDILEKAQHMHLSSVFLQKALKPDIEKLFQRAKIAGLTTSLDPQWDPSEKWDLDLKNLLPHVDVFLPNRAEFKHLTQCSDLKTGIDTLKDFANVIAIKDGKNGALLWDGQTLTEGPAFLNEEVADAIGAGDSFDAGFISQFIKGKSLEDCLQFANLTGAVNTTHSGGTGAFESMDKVKSIAASKYSFSI